MDQGMTVYAVRFGTTLARRYLAPGRSEGEPGKGWRSFVWVKDIQRAELFSSQVSAEAFAIENLGHALWDVVIAPGRGIPTDDLGGTPAAIRLAA